MYVCYYYKGKCSEFGGLFHETTLYVLPFDVNAMKMDKDNNVIMYVVANVLIVKR